MDILKQKISNHPLFANIKREVVITGVNIDSEYSEIVINAGVKYYDTNNNELDVTPAFSSKLEGWVINNNDLTTVRDAKGNAVRNPKYKETPKEGEDLRAEDEREEFLKAPSFDYFFGIITNPKAPSLINLLALHIQQNDAIHFFDKMLNLPIDESED